MNRHEQINALAMAIWKRETPANIYTAISDLFVQAPKSWIEDQRDAAIQDRDVAIKRAEKAEVALDKLREELGENPVYRTHPHINADGLFQSDKYPTCPPGKVPLSVKDKTAQDLLWSYAQRRRSVDAEFADDLETCLKAAGYDNGEAGYIATLPGDQRETDFQPAWVKYPRLRAAFQADAMLLTEFLPLLREARADAVQFIKDASAEELQKARREGSSLTEQAAGDVIVRLTAKCENLLKELDADTDIIRSHIELRTKAEIERDRLKLVVACAWRAYHGGFIEDAVKDLYATLVKYAPDGDLPAPNGEWVHCSPELLAEGVDCGSTKRRDCLDWPPGSHDHWVVREPIVQDADESDELVRPQQSFRITIRNTAGQMLEDGPHSPIVASRGRVFYVHDETIAGATAKFCNNGIPATERYPATPVLLTDFDIVPADESDIPEKAIENWTGARPG